ncbi:hypothetical protein BJ165DRAFT_1611832 [Panaeolus papilionaceus]|nr:hypothetical protein BJ165DRAFT_1611832 [Panaeolus papilionaceus]
MASSASQSPVFPLEIFHLILHNLSYTELVDDRTALNINDLRRCSLVCRAWAPICQAYLFKSATIDLERPPDFEPGPAKGIVPAIAAHPNIASHIQNIRYTIRVPMPAPVGDQEGRITDENISTLLTLPNLRSLFICVERTITLLAAPKFDDLCAGDFVFFRLWAAYTPSTSLVDLTLESIEDLPLATFLSCPSLRSLALMYCGCADLQPQAVPTTTSKIESIKLSGVSNISYAFLGFLPHLKNLFVCGVAWRISPNFRDQLISTLRNLKKLTLDCGLADDRQLWFYIPLFIAAGMGVKLFEHLQDLTVRPNSKQDAEVIYQALRHAPTIHYLDVKSTRSSLIPFLNIHRLLPQSAGNLKTLHIRFCISQFEEWYNHIEVISEALSLVKSPASLEELVLSVEVGSIHLLALFGMIPQLKLLDTALFVDSTMFALLRWITIRISVEHRGRVDSPPMVDSKMPSDLYEYVKSSFQASRRSSSNFRLNFKLWLETVKSISYF